MAAANEVVHEHGRGAATGTGDRLAHVLIYSDDRSTRAEIMALVGRRASADTPRISWTQTATDPAVVARVEQGGVDLVVLDGEAAKVGGIGLCRTLKTEIYRCPPVLVLIARSQDAWLASWSEADAVVSAPYDPIELQEAVASLLRPPSGRAEA